MQCLPDGLCCLFYEFTSLPQILIHVHERMGHSREPFHGNFHAMPNQQPTTNFTLVTERVRTRCVYDRWGQVGEVSSLEKLGEDLANSLPRLGTLLGR